MADLSVLQARLSEAEAALHSLMTGKTAVTISYQGHSVTYAQSEVKKLENYIALLTQQIAVAKGGRGRRSFRVKFT